MTTKQKILITLCVFSVSNLCLAQSMSEEDMQSMMKKAEEAQACFAKLDPASFKAMEKQGRAMEAEIKALCSAGKRSEAMSKTIAFVKEFNESKEYQELQNCSKIMEGMMQSMPMPDIGSDLDELDEGSHVCDEI